MRAEGERGRQRNRKGRGVSETKGRRASETKGRRGVEARGVRGAAGSRGDLPLERTNLALFGGALAVIVLGYVVLARGSITLAPLLLVLGYCVLVPIAIVYRPRSRRQAAPGGETPGPTPDPRGE